jgi:hypothetical protein
MLPSHCTHVGRSETAAMSERAVAASNSCSPKYFDNA